MNLKIENSINGIGNPDAKTFKKAVHYMNKNVYKNLTDTDIAKYCTSSSSTIKRIFDKSPFKHFTFHPTISSLYGS